MPKGSGGRPCRPRACVEVGHAGPGRGDGAQRGVAGGGRVPLADRKNRQHAVADEFQHFAAEGVNGAGDAVEPGVERGDHRLRRHRLRQLGEAAQIAIEQNRADGLAGLPPQPPGQHLRRAAPAEIGLEQRRERRPRGEDGERRRSKTRHLMQQRGFGFGEGPRRQPSRAPGRPTLGHASASAPAGDILLHHPVPSPASQSRPTLPCSGPAGPRDPKPSASITAPVSARHSQARRAMIGCGAASVSAPPASGKPSAISCAPSAARKRSAPGTAAGLVDQPGESRAKTVAGGAATWTSRWTISGSVIGSLLGVEWHPGASAGGASRNS